MLDERGGEKPLVGLLGFRLIAVSTQGGGRGRVNGRKELLVKYLIYLSSLRRPDKLLFVDTSGGRVETEAALERSTF